MIIGELLMYPKQTPEPPPDAYYSPWIPRGGNAMEFTVDVIAFIGATGSLQVDVETKNSEMDDNSASVLTLTGGAPGVGRTTYEVGAGLGDPTSGQGLLELVRFKYTVGDAGGDGVHFRILNPSWLSNGA